MTIVKTHLHLPKQRANEDACISVMPLYEHEASTYYAGTVALTNVTFIVQPAGHARVRESGMRNVHAFVKGELVSETRNQLPLRNRAGWKRAYYNPHKVDSFVDMQTGEALEHATAVYMVGSKVYYRD